MKSLSISTASLALSLSLAPLAAEFVNLDFERWAPSDPIPTDPFGRYDTRRALPGWTAGTPEDPGIPVAINNQFLNSAGVSVFSLVGSPQGPMDPSTRVLQGERSVYLQAGVELPSGPIVGVSLWQSGTVPAGMQSLEFLVGVDHSPFVVSVDGTPAWVIALGTPAEPTVNPALRYSVDLQGFAGREVELRFTVQTNPGQEAGGLMFDELRFSPAQVPEPATWTLLGLGMLGLVWNGLRAGADRSGPTS